MKEIGGYFSLELEHRGYFPHYDGVLLNSGRGALEYVLTHLKDIELLWIPYFTCDVVTEPLDKLKIPYSFYSINEQLEIKEPFDLQEGEYLLATNYFGLKGSYISQLAQRYGEKLIVDSAQGLFDEPLMGVNTIYSPRKFVGVADGGIAITNFDNCYELPIDESFDRCSHLLKRYDRTASDGYTEFKENSHKISVAGLKSMSNLTKCLLSNIDYERVKRQRIENFQYLHSELAATNLLKIDFEDYAAPMVYPYIPENDSLRGRLIENKIYVATYWPNVFEWCKETNLEYQLAKKIIPIPIDQRYEREDMDRILNVLKNIK